MRLYLFALLAGASAVFVETMFRKYSATVPLWRLLLIALPFQVLVGFCVFKIFTGAEYFLVGAIIFPFGTVTMRILANAFLFDETPPLEVYLAFGLVALAQVVRILPIKL